jgi:NADPH:quinone reductase-like Zn-dependent oxidoreductase
MKAMVYDSGGPGGMSWVSTQKLPKVGKNDILVRVATSSINPMDAEGSHSFFSWFASKTSRIVGKDFAGTVVAVGKSVYEYHTGDHVFGWGHGYAEYLICHPTEVVKIPEGTSVSDFGQYACAGVTAHQILRHHWLDIPNASVRNILVIGASGGVGSCVVQLARALGGPEIHITGLCSGKNGDYIRNIGANDSIDYTAGGFDLSRSLPVRSLDLIIDVVSGSGRSFPNYVDDGMLLLKPSGTYVVLNSQSRIEKFRAMTSRMTGWHLQKPHYDLHMTQIKKSEKDLFVIGRLVANGKLKLHVSEEIPLLEVPIRRALIASKNRHTKGKIRIVAENYSDRGFSSPVETRRT